MSSQRGSVRKRTFKNTETWTAYWRDHEGRQRTKGGFRTKREAQAHLTDVLGAIRSGTYVEASKMTVAAYLQDHWLPSLTVAESTAASYRREVEGWVIPEMGGMRLSALTPAQVAEWQNSLAGSPRRDGRGVIGARTAQYISTIFRRALGDAVRLGLIARSPAAAVPRLRAARPEMTAWSAPEARAFLASVDGDRLSALWWLLTLRGLRRGEALGLRWVDVDLEAGRISIRRAIIAIGYEVRVSEPKTAKSRRTIPLDATLVAALSAHRRRQLEERLAWGEGWQDSGLVFTREDGTVVHPQTVSRTFERLVRRAGVRAIRLHDLRHTTATLSIGSGVPVKVVSEWLGHATTAITTDLYQHATPAMLEEAGARLTAAILGEAPGGTR